MTSDKETMIWSRVKQLDRAFLFVWETAGMEGILQLQGHICCVRTESRTLAYRGNTFLICTRSGGAKIDRQGVTKQATKEVLQAEIFFCLFIVFEF